MRKVGIALREPILKNSKPASPRAPVLTEPLESADFSETVARVIDEDGEVAGFSFQGGFCDAECLDLEFENCIVQGVRMPAGSLKKSFFTDVIFRRCDFSNAVFEAAKFLRVRFEDCKLVGADFSDASFTDVTVRACKAGCLLLSLSRMKTVAFEDCDLGGAALHEVKHKNLSFTDCTLTGAELFRTPLAGLDFTTDEISGISVLPQDLQGATVSAMQACELAKLLGLIIK